MKGKSVIFASTLDWVLRMEIHGVHPLVKVKFKDFSRTFKALFQYIQGPRTGRNL
jgi:hypothetical protein